MKFTIVEITDWEQDEAAMSGDESHVGAHEVHRLLFEEEERKVEKGEWPGLPFTCDAQDKDDAIDLYNETHCQYDYIKATGADFEED